MVLRLILWKYELKILWCLFSLFFIESTSRRMSMKANINLKPLYTTVERDGSTLIKERTKGNQGWTSLARESWFKARRPVTKKQYYFFPYVRKPYFHLVEKEFTMIFLLNRKEPPIILLCTDFWIFHWLRQDTLMNSAI